MENVNMKAFFKCAISGLVTSIILFIIAIIIVNVTTHTLNNVLFIEGMLAIGLAILSSVSGNPLGLSLQALNQTNAQYVAHSSLETARIEKQISLNTIATQIKVSFSMISLAIAGALCIILNFIF